MTDSDELDALRAQVEELRAALLKWKAYFQADIPKTGDEQEASGEEFTDAWFAMERALNSMPYKLKKPQTHNENS